MGTKARLLRSLLTWMLRAISSLPVPLAPVMRTVNWVGRSS